MKLRHAVRPLFQASPVVVPAPSSFILAFQLGQLGFDTGRCLVKQRPEVVVTSREDAVRSRDIDEHFRVNSVMIESDYHLGGVVSQKMLGGVQVIAVLETDKGPAQAVIVSVFTHHNKRFPDQSAMGLFRRGAIPDSATPAPRSGGRI